jgi:hypothetical protein
MKWVAVAAALYAASQCEIHDKDGAAGLLWFTALAIAVFAA